MTRLLDGAPSAARYKSETTPLTPKRQWRALARSSTLYAAIKTFRAKIAAENSKRRQEEEKSE